MNREQWLESAVAQLRERVFKHAGHEVPAVRVSVGFPGGGDRRKTIGECWSPEASEDKRSQIFITPTLRDTVRVLDVLTHELIHAIRPGAGHGKEFRKIAVAVGLTGPMRATVAGENLKIQLAKIGAEIGEYPHAALSVSHRKKQTTRLIKMQCATCEYVVRAARSSIEKHGPVYCPCGEQMAVHQPEGE